jgi:hypothetical protein
MASFSRFTRTMTYASFLNNPGVHPMLRNAIVLAGACLLLSACQRDAAPETDAATAAPATDSAAPATSVPATAPEAAPAAALAPIVVEPFGVESCDAFVAAINKCFATAKAHPSAVQMLRPMYEEEIQRWRRMKDSPNMAGGIEIVCKTQMDNFSHVREGFQCE